MVYLFNDVMNELREREFIFVFDGNIVIGSLVMLFCCRCCFFFEERNIMKKFNILMIVIFSSCMGDIDKFIGLWVEELVVLYYVLVDVGVLVVIVFIVGGKMLIDLGSFKF